MGLDDCFTFVSLCRETSGETRQFFRVGEKGKGGGARSARGRGAPEGAAGGGAGGAAMRRRRIGTYRYDWERFHHTHCHIHRPARAWCMHVLNTVTWDGVLLCVV